MTATLRIDPSRLPVPRLPATPSLRPDPIPEGLPIIVLPNAAAPHRSEWTHRENREKEKQPRKPRNDRMWTEERDAELIRLVNQRIPTGKIAARMRLEEKQIRGRISKLREKDILPPAQERRPNVWKEEENERLIRSYNEGRSISEMSEELGRTQHAVAARIYALRKKRPEDLPFRPRVFGRDSFERSNN